MKCTAYLESITADGHLVFQLPENALEAASSLRPGFLYTLDVSSEMEGRSLPQNGLLWKIISDINMAENGSRKTSDDKAIYKNILVMAGVGVNVVTIHKDQIKELAKQFRVVEIIDKFDNYYVCKCYIGTSSMTVGQMSAVIDAALMYAENLGLDPEVYGCDR